MEMSLGWRYVRVTGGFKRLQLGVKTVGVFAGIRFTIGDDNANISTLWPEMLHCVTYDYARVIFLYKQYIQDVGFKSQPIHLSFTWCGSLLYCTTKNFGFHVLRHFYPFVYCASTPKTKYSDEFQSEFSSEL